VFGTDNEEDEMSRRAIVLLTALLGLTFAQWSPRGGGDHGGADWTPANGDVISGYHYNIGTFTVTSGYSVGVLGWTGGDTSGHLRVSAATISIQGTLDAQGRGYGGGGGGNCGSSAQGQPGWVGTGGAGGNGGNAGTFSNNDGGGGGGGSPNGAGGVNPNGYPTQNGQPGTLTGGGAGRGYQGGGAGGTGYGGGGGGGAGSSGSGYGNSGGGGGGGTGGTVGALYVGGNGGSSPSPANGGAGGNQAAGTPGGYNTPNGNSDATTDTSIIRGGGGGGGGAFSTNWSGSGGGGGAGGGKIALDATGALTLGAASLVRASGAGGGLLGLGYPGYNSGRNAGGGGGGGVRLMGMNVTLNSGAQIVTQGYNNANSPQTSNGGTIKIFYGSLTNNATLTYGRLFIAQVTVHDVGCTRIIAPPGTVNLGTVVTPACSVYNFGTASETYTVRMKIGSGYSNPVTVTSHAAGTRVYVTFPSWTANTAGANAVTCSTELSGDAAPANNKVTGSVFVQTFDAQAVSIVAPTGNVLQGSVVTPLARVRNGGNTTVTFDVKFDLSDGYFNTQSVTLNSAAETVLTFGSWTANTLGTLVTKCSTRLSGDMTPGNDKVTGSVTVNRYEVGVVAIVSPTDPSAPGSIIPRATVRNYGNARQLTTVTMQINSATPYSQTVSLSGGLPAGADTAVDFPAWTATNGIYVAHCSVSTANDPVRANDTLSKAFRVGDVDVAANAILAPVGNFDSTQVVTPSAKVQNNGDFTATFTAWFKIDDGTDAVVYDQNIAVTGLSTGVETTLVFPLWAKPHMPGSYTAKCSVHLAGDGNPANDLRTGSFTVTVPSSETGWVQKASLPAGPKSKNVKDGGCLTGYEPAGDTAYIYGLKGNGRYEYYRFNVAANTWIAKESIPAIGSSGKKKPVKKGACIADRVIVDGGDDIYATKGNGTTEWWQYDPALSGTSTYPWTEKAGVPPGAKACKEGCGAATVQLGDTSFVYFLKGSGTQEFYRYNATSNTWQTMTNAPTGTSGKPFKDGSCLATDGSTTVWALKGSFNELFAYDVATNAWTDKTTLPLTGSSGKKKKVKSGGAMAYHAGIVYAQKGNNTNEFWSYQCDSDRWVQKTDIPAGSGKNVKGGGAMTYVANDNALYIFKGNNTLDFFKYGLSAYGLQLTANSQNEMSSGRQPSAVSRLLISPNPFSNTTTISYSLPTAANYSLKLYDVTGQLISTLASGNRNAGSYTLTTPTLARGIYVLKLATNNTTNTAKLIVE
jgi:hypothetical protein